MSLKIVRAFSFSLLITAKSWIHSLMTSNGRVTSISMAIKGEADNRLEDSTRGSPNQLHTSSNMDNHLCAHLSFLFSPKCKTVSFLVDLFGGGILQNKGCLDSVSISVPWNLIDNQLGFYHAWSPTGMGCKTDRLVLPDLQQMLANE